MTTNSFEDFLTGGKIDFVGSHLLTIALARTLDQWRDLLVFELEGQASRHFGIQDHWEFNLLGTVRWIKLPWRETLPTSIAFGIGPSWATDEPEIEIDNDGETDRTLVYWMLELSIAPFPTWPNLELISRLHHRSDAFGLVADDGGSNALGIGLKYRF